MATDSTNDFSAKLKQWADDLVCPVCRARLHFEVTRVVCTGCARIYPVEDGIPVLIPQRATKPVNP
jgi:uncharacterized protein YbaR (Trm112 family)